MSSSQRDNTDGRGGNLIFLISQPRAGSTLLQHILASHSRIHSLPEPWFMLHLVYGLRSEGISTEYNARLAHQALGEFLGRVPGGEQAYIDVIRQAARSLYANALAGTGKSIFLDKTPRYFLIIPQLLRIFPEAKFVFLVRNPLAVLSSKLHRLGDKPVSFFSTDALHDIHSAPKLILDGIAEASNRGAVVQYETLVADPAAHVRSLCERIGLDYEPDMLDYGRKVRFDDSRLGDQGRIYQHDRPVADYSETWWSRFDTPARAAAARRCLETLGAETIAAMGYNYGEMSAKIDGITRDVRRSPRAWLRQWRTTRTAHRLRRFRSAIQTRLSTSSGKPVLSASG